MKKTSPDKRPWTLKAMPLTLSLLTLVALYMLLNQIRGNSPANENIKLEASALLDSEPIKAIKDPEGLNLSKAQLGKKLFYDRRLSVNNTVSCASCHDLKAGGADGKSHSIGATGKTTAYNSQSIINSSLNTKLTWLGRYGSRHEQTEQLVINPATMGSNWIKLEEKLNADKALKAEFVTVYHKSASKDAIVDALVEYEKSLCITGSPFDAYLAGNKASITKEEADGYRLFKAYGCASCHQGMNVGGNMFMKFGIFEDYFKPDIVTNLGRFQLTGREEDRYVFRVPSLRNVELTAPYFHDGSVASLDQAVSVMAKYQLGRELPSKDRQKIVAFLKTLTAVPKNNE